MADKEIAREKRESREKGLIFVRVFRVFRGQRK